MYNVMRGLCLLTLAAVAQAQPRNPPIFNIRVGIERATHVVVVAEGETIDGTVTVLESWRGALQVGAKITIPALKAFADRERFYIADGATWAKPPKIQARRSPNLQRMVLFLVHRNGKLCPVIFDRLESSTLWVQRKGPNGIYGWQHGADRREIRVMHPWTEPLLSGWVRGWDACLPKLVAARKIQDPKERAAAIAPLCDLWPLRGRTFPALQRCGDPAIPHLWRMFLDPAVKYGFWGPLRGIHAVGGNVEQEKLLQFIRDELGHWAKVAPTLPKDWRLRIETPEGRRLDRLVVALALFVEHRDARLRPIAKKIMTMTTEIEQLGGPPGWGLRYGMRWMARRVLNDYRPLPREAG